MKSTPQSRSKLLHSNSLKQESLIRTDSDSNNVNYCTCPWCFNAKGQQLKFITVYTKLCEEYGEHSL